MKKILVVLAILLVLITVTTLVRNGEKISIESTPPMQQNQTGPTSTNRQGLYSISFDLNYDDSPETLELSQECGTGGCDLSIMTTQNGTIATVAKINLVQSVFLGTTTSQGWTDLVVETSGGGAPRNAYLIKFDGSTYPTYPEDGMEIETTEGLTKVF